MLDQGVALTAARAPLFAEAQVAMAQVIEAKQREVEATEYAGTSIMAHLEQPITEGGLTGGMQAFVDLFGPSADKRRAGTALVKARRMRRLSEIEPYPLFASRYRRSAIMALAHAAKCRRRAANGWPA